MPCECNKSAPRRSTTTRSSRAQRSGANTRSPISRAGSESSIKFAFLSLSLGKFPLLGDKARKNDLALESWAFAAARMRSSSSARILCFRLRYRRTRSHAASRNPTSSPPKWASSSLRITSDVWFTARFDEGRFTVSTCVGQTGTISSVAEVGGHVTNPTACDKIQAVGTGREKARKSR